MIYAEDWAAVLQDRLDKPTNFKEVCRVDITNSRVLNNPYMSTVPTVQSHTRGTAYTHQTFAITNESITISASAVSPQFIDWADLAQTDYAKQMELADMQATLLNEQLESAMLASYGSWTDFGGADIGLGGASTDQITVSVSNIDDIIRNLKKAIITSNGLELLNRHGMFIIWRPADFEKLENFMQANGFNTADAALKDGASLGVYYMGCYHYVSNSHTANHLFGGVRKQEQLGIVRDTFGKVYLNGDPADAGNGNLSGLGIVSRVDYAFKTWTNTKPLLFDINVA